MVGVSFNGLHCLDMGLIMSERTIGAPSPKYITVEVPGRDGVIDFTENVFGGVKFGERKIEIKFLSTQSFADKSWSVLYSLVASRIHGRKLKIVFDDDADYYYIGRVSIKTFTCPGEKVSVTINCDCEPYKYKEEITTVSFTGTGEYTLDNAFKKVVPKITTTEETKIEFDGSEINLGVGEFTVPVLQLKEGENRLNITTTGTVTFEYQEGVL